MCLVAFSWKVHPQFPLIISANRDEFFHRPTASLQVWDSGIYAGKDLRSGGTWTGFHPDGRWSLLTNYRDFANPKLGGISRGKLVSEYLEADWDPADYLDRVFRDKDRYEGFNLLVADQDRLFYFSNYGEDRIEVPPGVHGLSNALLDVPWPKTALAKAQLTALQQHHIEPDNLLSILKSTETYSEEILPDTGISTEMEIQLSAQLIRMPPDYGTVSSTSVLRDRDGITQIKERTFAWDPEIYRDVSFSFHT